MEHQVGQNVEGLGEVLIENLGVEADQLLGGEGVEIAAESVHARAMSSAERLVVPLNSMCSMKWEMPFCSGVSRREPEPIQMPTETERTCGMASVITRTPLASVVISISRKGLIR